MPRLGSSRRAIPSQELSKIGAQATDQPTAATWWGPAPFPVEFRFDLSIPACHCHRRKRWLLAERETSPLTPHAVPFRAPIGNSYSRYRPLDAPPPYSLSTVKVSNSLTARTICLSRASVYESLPHIRKCKHRNRVVSLDISQPWAVDHQG